MEKFYPSKPRLDLSHGFIQQIRQNQFVRAQDDQNAGDDPPGGAQEQHSQWDRQRFLPARLSQAADDVLYESENTSQGSDTGRRSERNLNTHSVCATLNAASLSN